MQPDFKDWLARKPKGPAPKRPLKRKKRLRRASAKQGKALTEYLRLRRIYLTKNYACEAGPIITNARMPNGYRRPVCDVWANQIHHIAGRGPNLCNVDTFCATCSPCHAFIHAHGQWARGVGLLT